MYEKANKTNSENISRAVANHVGKRKSNEPGSVRFEDNRPEAKAQKSLQLMIANSHKLMAQHQLITQVSDSPAQMKDERRIAEQGDRRKNDEKITGNPPVVQCYSMEMMGLLHELFGGTVTEPLEKQEDGGIKSLKDLHEVFRILGERLKTESNEEIREMLNHAIVLVGNEIGGLSEFGGIETLPDAYQNFVGCKKVLLHDGLGITPNEPLGNNLISLSLTLKGSGMLNGISEELIKSGNNLHIIKGGWTTSDVSEHDKETGFARLDGIKTGDIVVAANFKEKVEVRARAIDADKRHILSPDVILLGHEMGHVLDKVKNQEDTLERKGEYARRKEEMGETDNDWQNIKEWGVTTKHQNPLEEEFNIPQRGTYLDRRSRESSAIYNELSGELMNLEGKLLDLKNASIEKPSEILMLFQRAAELVTPLLEPKMCPGGPTRLDEYKVKNAGEAKSLIGEVTEAVEIVDKILTESYLESKKSESYEEPKKPEEKKGGSWCFITTACVVAKSLPDDCYELTTLRKFRDGYMRNLEGGERLIDEYYEMAPKIVTELKKSPQFRVIIDDIYQRLILDSIKLIENNRHQDALLNYKTVVEELKDDFL